LKTVEYLYSVHTSTSTSTMAETNYKFEAWMGLDPSSADGNMVWQEFQPKEWEGEFFVWKPLLCSVIDPSGQKPMSISRSHTAVSVAATCTPSAAAG
jgi:hypothetical protein